MRSDELKKKAKILSDYQRDIYEAKVKIAIARWEYLPFYVLNQDENIYGEEMIENE
ncbi:MAG: hypothetical protein ACUVT9_05430 [Candidatus Bathycorpusculaceae bacterium]